MNKSRTTDVSRNWPFYLAGAVLLWGLVIAVGAYLRYRTLDKPLVIAVSTVVFATLWLMAARWMPPRR